MTYQPADRRNTRRALAFIVGATLAAWLIPGFVRSDQLDIGQKNAILAEARAQEYTHAWYADPDPAPPAPVPSVEETTFGIKEFYEPGEPIIVCLQLPEGQKLVDVDWELPLRYIEPPDSLSTIYVWPIGVGSWQVRANFIVDTGGKLSIQKHVETLVVGEKPAPKSLRELAGKDAGQLAKVYATLAKGSFTSLVHFHNVEAVGLGDLQRSPAVAAIADRLKAIAPFDAAKLSAEVAAIAKELGAEPEPPVPPTPPVVVGKRYVVVLSETENHTPAVGLLINSLRTGDTAAYLKSKGHVLDILDDDNPAPIVAKLAALGVQEPALFVLDPTTGAVLHSQPLPATAAEVLTILKAHGG